MAKKNKSRSSPPRYCIDFDDLCDNAMVQERDGQPVNLIDFLAEWKSSTPALKLTLFTIPARTSAATISSLRSLGDWIALAPHGWRHTRGECLGWSEEEAAAKIQAAASLGIDAPCFRAPGWLLDADTYTACSSMSYVVCTHSDYRIPNTDVPEYVYNLPKGVSQGVTPIHGHLTPTADDNWIYNLRSKGALNFPADSTFYYPWEVAVIIHQTYHDNPERERVPL